MDDDNAELFAAVTEAAGGHAEADGDIEYEIGDLEVLFRAAYGLLPRAMHAEFWALPAIRELLEIPEFEHRVAPLVAAMPATPYGVSPTREAWVAASPTGMLLVCEAADANGGGTDYVRVVAPNGGEVAYWIHTEWEAQPVEVMGAVCGALRHRDAPDPARDPEKFYQVAPDVAFPPGTPFLPYAGPGGTDGP